METQKPEYDPAGIRILDHLDEDALMRFWARFHRPRRKDAIDRVGRRPLYTVIVATLANYACNRAVAMQCRRRGDERAARTYDHAVNLCRERLPDDIRALLKGAS